MRVDEEKFYWQIDLVDEVFLIDLSWVFYKSWYSYEDLSVEDEEGNERYTGHIYGVLRTIMSIKEYNKNSIIVLCEDGQPVERKEENEDYKANRSHDLKYNIWQDLDIIYDLAFRLGRVYKAYHPKREADDVLYALAKNIEKETDSTYVYIHSSDNDLLQALSNRVRIAKKVSKYGITEINKDNLYESSTMVKNFRECPVEKLPIYRAIIGDSSDNLDGIYRFPRKFATKIAKNCDNIEDIKDLEFDNLTNAKKRRLKQVKDEEWEKVKSNYKMMKLSDDIDFRIYRNNDEKSKKRADRIADKLKLSSYKNFLIKSGIKDTYE